MNEPQNQPASGQPTMPIDPWTGKPYTPDGVRRLISIIKSANEEMDEIDRGGVNADDAIWRLRVALGRLAKA